MAARQLAMANGSGFRRWSRGRAGAWVGGRNRRADCSRPDRTAWGGTAGDLGTPRPSRGCRMGPPVGLQPPRGSAILEPRLRERRP